VKTSGIPKVLFRPFAGVADYAHLVEVRGGVRVCDQLDPASPLDAIPTVDDLARSLSEAIGSPAVLVVEVNGVVVGYNRVARLPDEGGADVYFHRGWLLPAWRGRGIGGAMLRSAESRLRDMALGHPSPRPAILATTATSIEQGTIGLLDGAGYHLAWRLRDMVTTTDRELSELALPAEIIVRALDPAHHHAIFEAARDAWTGQPFAPDDPDAYFDDTVRKPGFDATLCQVAWIGEEVVGVVLSQQYAGEGFILDVAVRRAWQRQGIARALLLRCLHSFAAEGITRARLYVDAVNMGAQELYERIGFHAVKDHNRYQKSLIPHVPTTIVKSSASG